MSETPKSVWLIEVRFRERKNGKWSEWESSEVPDLPREAWPYYPADRVIQTVYYERRAVEYTRVPEAARTEKEGQ